MEFKDWWYLEPHRHKYDPDTPAYLAGLEAWEAQDKRIAELEASIERLQEGNMRLSDLNKDLRQENERLRGEINHKLER